MNFRFKKYIFAFFLLFISNFYSAISFGKKQKESPCTTYSFFKYIQSFNTKNRKILVDKNNQIISQEDIIVYLKNFKKYLKSINVDPTNIPNNFLTTPANERNFLDYYATQLVPIHEEVSYCASEVVDEENNYIPSERGLRHFQDVPSSTKIKPSKFI
jgi:hypothetical protein